MEVIINNLSQSLKLVINNNTGIGPRSKIASIVLTNHIKSSVVKQEESIGACGLDFSHMSVMGVKEVVDFF